LCYPCGWRGSCYPLFPLGPLAAAVVAGLLAVRAWLAVAQTARVPRLDCGLVALQAAPRCGLERLLAGSPGFAGVRVACRYDLGKGLTHRTSQSIPESVIIRFKGVRTSYLPLHMHLPRHPNTRRCYGRVLCQSTRHASLRGFRGPPNGAGGLRLLAVLASPAAGANGSPAPAFSPRRNTLKIKRTHRAAVCP